LFLFPRGERIKRIGNALESKKNLKEKSEKKRKKKHRTKIKASGQRERKGERVK
jgi:hypothetical protein